MNEQTSENKTISAKKLPGPDDVMEKFGKGKMLLKVPIQDGENLVTTLHWDFTMLTGAEYANAMDQDSKASNNFRLSNTQALCLFAAAAGKATDGLNAEEIRRGISMVDAVKAAQLATVFFSASSRGGDARISES